MRYTTRPIDIDIDIDSIRLIFWTSSTTVNNLRDYFRCRLIVGLLLPVSHLCRLWCRSLFRINRRSRPADNSFLCAQYATIFFIHRRWRLSAPRGGRIGHRDGDPAVN